MLKIDACGLSCPEPLLMLKKGIASNSDNQPIELLLSSQNALANCKRFAEGKGYKVEVAEDGEAYRLTMTKE